MGSYRKPRKRHRHVIGRNIPFVLDSNGVDDLASVDERVKLAEKAGVPYVYMEYEKPNGRKVKFLIHAEYFKRLSKADINKLYKGLT